jgi:hypothetical protein
MGLVRVERHAVRGYAGQNRRRQQTLVSHHTPPFVRGHAFSDDHAWKRRAHPLQPDSASSGCATASWMSAQMPPEWMQLFGSVFT